MKTINKILNVALAVTMIFAASSCKEDQGWSVDKAYDRLFGVNDGLSVTPLDTKAYVNFTKVPNATYYIIEISTDTLYDEIQKGGTAHSKVFGEDKTITEADTIRGLVGDTQYFLRVKSMSETKESRWVYYSNSKGGGTFKTKAEQIFLDPIPEDRDEDRVTLHWQAGAEVTSIAVYKGSERQDSILLDATAKAEGTYTVTGLNPSTTYKFFIYLETSKRGELSIATTAAMPAASYKITLDNSVTVIDQDLIDQIAATAQEKAGSTTSYSATIGIPAGATLGMHGTSDAGDPTSIKFPEGMSVTFFGLAGGDTPTLKLQKQLELGGAHAFIAFENVNLEDDGAGYMVNQSKPCAIDKFSMKDCEVSKFKTSFFRLQGADAKSIETVELTNSIFHDMCSGYSFLHIDASSGKGGGVNNIIINGCTLYKIATTGKMFIYSRNYDMTGDIKVSNTTFYNCIGNGNYWIDFGAATNGARSVTFEKCIFGKTPDEATNKNFRGTNSIVWDGCYRTNDFFKFNTVSELVDTGKSSADIFTDPDNGDFTLKTFFDAGDPRWIPQD